MDRRSFLLTAAAGWVVSCDAPFFRGMENGRFASSTEVIGDGKWVWTKPPLDKKGFLEPRPFEFKTSITIQGVGRATGIQSSTAVPVELPEQKIDDVSVQTQGCQARFRQLTPTAGQMVIAAPSVARG